MRKESLYYSKYIDIMMLRGCQILRILTQKENVFVTKLKTVAEVAKLKFSRKFKANRPSLG